MYGELFFLFILFFLASLAGDLKVAAFTISWVQGVIGIILGLFAYFCAIAAETRYLLKTSEKLSLLILKVEVLIAAFLFLFIFNSIDIEIPLKLFFTAVFVFSLYFLTLAVYYRCKKKTLNQAAGFQFMLPFILPLLFASLLYEAVSYIQTEGNEGVVVALTCALLVLFLFEWPRWVVKIWRCPPLENGELKQRLEAFCAKVNFKHSGLYVWSVMRAYLTAAIIGSFKRSRSILFTEKLLNRLNPEEVECVLAHEIGHSVYHHLLWLPLILMGVICPIALYQTYVYPELMQFGEALFNGYQSPYLEILLFTVNLCILLIVIGIFFRVVFGYFSRLFEKQADLYVLEVGLRPDDLIAALNKTALHSGILIEQPSWHHGSIKERIEVLKDAQNDPTLISRHKLKLKLSLAFYIGFMSTYFWLAGF